VLQYKLRFEYQGTMTLALRLLDVGIESPFCYVFPQVGPERTCFSFTADRWYPVANMSIDHLIMIQEYSETGNLINQIF
jgi:A-macroglobulin receptor binding domain